MDVITTYPIESDTISLAILVNRNSTFICMRSSYFKQYAFFKDREHSINNNPFLNRNDWLGTKLYN